MLLPANPRAKYVFDSLMKHLHIWATEVDLTIDEWLGACDVVSGAPMKSRVEGMYAHTKGRLLS